MKETIELAVVDDSLVFRDIVTLHLEKEKDIKVILKASNGKELITALKAKKKKPDVILLDLLMPVMDGKETLEYVSQNYPHIKVLILTYYHEPGISHQLIEKGANGFVFKDTDLEKLPHIIRTVHKQHYYFVGWNMKEIIDLKSLGKEKQISSKIIFTPRELEILKFICSQYTNQEISKKIGISYKTVGTYRNRLLKKANSRNTTGLILYAIKHGIINQD